MSAESLLKIVTIEVVEKGVVKLFELQTSNEKAEFAKYLDEQFGSGNWKLLEVRRVI